MSKASQKLQDAHAELSLSLQTVKKQINAAPPKDQSKMKIKEEKSAAKPSERRYQNNSPSPMGSHDSKQGVFKKESNHYLNYIGVDLPEKSRRQKPPVERLFEVNIGPEPQPKYTDNNVRSRGQKRNSKDQDAREQANYVSQNNDLAETFYLDERESSMMDELHLMKEGSTLSPKR